MTCQSPLPADIVRFLTEAGFESQADGTYGHKSGGYLSPDEVRKLMGIELEQVPAILAGVWPRREGPTGWWYVYPDVEGLARHARTSLYAETIHALLRARLEESL